MRTEFPFSTSRCSQLLLATSRNARLKRRRASTDVLATCYREFEDQRAGVRRVSIRGSMSIFRSAKTQRPICSSSVPLAKQQVSSKLLSKPKLRGPDLHAHMKRSPSSLLKRKPADPHHGKLDYSVIRRAFLHDIARSCSSAPSTSILTVVWRALGGLLRQCKWVLNMPHEHQDPVELPS